MEVKVIGAGLAGCECALQLANAGIRVKLYDIKPSHFTPAHSNTDLCELVCSNSLKSELLSTASGLLKEELNLLGSFVMEQAQKVKVPAGSALAVDRVLFARNVTELIKNNSLIEFISGEVTDFNENEYTVIATGPLTTDKLSETIRHYFGENLHFYDAEAPIISADSIDYDCTFTANRYGKGDSDYINCPLNEEQYKEFYNALVNAECATLKDFEKREIFEGCMPIEIMASRGVDTLRYGPLRPVGFIDPKTDKRPYCVVQLRKENTLGDSYNIVGFQTNLKFGEQKRVFSLIPALKNAEFLRYGVMHRNSFINAPKIINKHFQTLKFPKVFLAGQISGVEGYVESIMSGLVCGKNIARLINGKSMLTFPLTTIIGALGEYLQTPNTNFQPMNANFGILPPLEEKIKDKQKKKENFSLRAIKDLKNALISI